MPSVASVVLDSVAVDVVETAIVVAVAVADVVSPTPATVLETPGRDVEVVPAPSVHPARPRIKTVAQATQTRNGMSLILQAA